MTEAELFSAFHESLAAVYSILAVYLSLISGFLLMSYLVAHKLSRLLASIVLALFSVTSGLLIFKLVLNRNDALGLIRYMFEQKDLGILDFSWLPVYPEWVDDINFYLEFAVTFGGYIGCLAFFFYQRKAGSGNK